MKPFRIHLLLLAGALTLIACKSKEETALEAAPSNPLLAYVSADTPYLFANLEPTPALVVDAYLARFQPSLDLVQSMLDDLNIEVHSDGSTDMNFAALIGALVNEMDGKLNRAGLESLGLSLESHKALYGMGAFPVMRMALRDAEALRDAIARVEAAAGMSFPVSEAGGVAYWKLAAANQPAGVYIVILQDHLAISLFPTAMEAELLPELLGQSAPPQAFDASQELARLNIDKGFLHHGSGFADLRKMAAELMQPDSRTRLGLSASGQVTWPEIDAVCSEEINGLIDRAPRFVVGTTELSANAIGIKYQLEMEPTLAGQMVKLVSDVPPASDNPALLASMSVAIQAGRLREFLLEKASELATNPFQCPQLQALNQVVNSGLAQMNRPMPPFIGNINGFRLQLDKIDLKNLGPENLSGILVLEIEKPQMLVGSAQMFVPGLDGLELEPGSEPVEVPQELMTMAIEGMHLSVAMSKDALGLAMGKSQQAGLLDFLEAGGDNEGTFLSASYDIAAQMDLQDALQDQALTDASNDGDIDPETERMMAMIRATQQSYRDLLGRARLELRLVPEGFEIYNHVTFE